MTSLNPVFTIGSQMKEAVVLHTEKRGKEADDRVVELLELVGINEPRRRVKQYPFELSGGMQSYPYKMVFPAIIICLIVLSFNLLGDGLRDAFDPKLRR